MTSSNSSGLLVSPKQFQAVMQKVLRDNEKLLLKHWEDPKKYTDEVWGAKHGRTGVIYKAIAENLGMKLFQEYWEVDAVYYKDKCDLASTSSERATIVSVALDHENEPKGSYREISRLLNRTALLKVVVTYPASDGRNLCKDLCEGYVKQIKVVDNAIKNFSARQPIMVVFGYRVSGDAGKTLKWSYRVYDQKDGFKLLD